MKRLFTIVIGLTIGLMLMLTSCKDDDVTTESGIQIDKTEISFDAAGGQEKVNVIANGEWVASASEPWITVSPANGSNDMECVITIDSTLITEAREANVRFMLKDGSYGKKIKLTQLGFGKQIHVDSTSVHIEASTNIISDRYFEVMVTANVPFEIDITYPTSGGDPKLSNWLSIHEPPITDFESARPYSQKLRFDWKINPEWDERTAQIIFNPIKAEDEGAARTPITVTQKAAPVITDDRAGDSLALVAIHERLNTDLQVDYNENMRYWKNLTLWERNDDLPKDENGNPIQEAIGRVRFARFTMFNTKESIPYEVSYLKYAETLSFDANANTMLLNIDLGNEICELKYLKRLQISAYGLVSLPDDFVKLGDKLEVLDLSDNNFESIPSILTQENFPKLKALALNGNRRWSVVNLQSPYNYTLDEIGLHINLDEKPNALDQLFFWDNLESLSLTYNYLEGTLPDYKDRPAYTYADIAESGDTLTYLVDHKIPKILPNVKSLGLNLNFFTGKLPDWILYHPNLIEWYPEIFIFNQMETGIDSKGQATKFSNRPTNFEYYFEAFPDYRGKYEYINDEEEEE
ncbi:MAG: BACON domain-containing protein [Fermentimonas sp.]